jgi:hypothetical protein
MTLPPSIKGHIDDNGGMVAAAYDRSAMRCHHLHGDGHSMRQAVNHLRQRIANQQHIAMRIHQLRHAHGIGGQHDQRFAALPLPNARYREPLHRLRRRVRTAGGYGQGQGFGCGGHGPIFLLLGLLSFEVSYQSVGTG